MNPSAWESNSKVITENLKASLLEADAIPSIDPIGRDYVLGVPKGPERK